MPNRKPLQAPAVEIAGAIDVLEVPKRVFVLGDSRTGTMSVHKFLKAAGYRSIHFFYKESGVSEPAHIDYENNWKKLKAFIDSSAFDAFSDYPLRLFYRELIQEYPDDLFILTSRKDTETWQRSVTRFFAKFEIKVDLDELTGHYLGLNDDIRRLAGEKSIKFCDICIDDDNTETGHQLSGFLGLKEKFSLGWENKTDHYDNAIWSSRATIYNTSDENVLAYLKRATLPSKAMLSEYGWVYLINDSSDFMDYAYGTKVWTSDVLNTAEQTLRGRKQKLEESGMAYLKFAVPEKSAIYPQYLPKIFKGQEPSALRPAVQLDSLKMDFFSYPAAMLRDARSFGLLYFRGDSHVNWTGAYFLYCHIVETMNAALRARGAFKQMLPINLKELSGQLAGYAGDLYGQLDAEAKKFYKSSWKTMLLDGVMEHTIKYAIKPDSVKSKRIPVDPEYLALLGERETYRFSNPEKALPKALIFRDSTLDFALDLLAEHFSESLFVWHKGHVYKDIIEREKPDIVLHIMAERFLVQYAKAAGFYDIGLTAN